MANGRLPAAESAEAASLTPPRALTRSTAQIRLRNTASPVLANGPLRPSIMAILIGAGMACENDRVDVHKAASSRATALRENMNILKSLWHTAVSGTDAAPAVVLVESRAVYLLPVGSGPVGALPCSGSGARNYKSGGLTDIGCRRPSLCASSTAELTPIFSKICAR